ncbi:hypothetical protein J6590_039635 [Homalodisca vitripennis]|nr:hypothetical protein J6590_039635 [Homalodisca vitripennis]
MEISLQTDNGLTPVTSKILQSTVYLEETRPRDNAQRALNINISMSCYGTGRGPNSESSYICSPPSQQSCNGFNDRLK